jgi:Thiamine pyrophosphate enzyme, N-terminal TPP binding domain
VGVELPRRSAIVHEQAAAFMAATHGRLTAKSGVYLTTLGAGALNLTKGRAHALLGATADGDDHWSERDFEPEAGTARSCTLETRQHEALDRPPT